MLQASHRRKKISDGGLERFSYFRGSGYATSPRCALAHAIFVLGFNRTEKLAASKLVLVFLYVFGCAGLTANVISLCLLNRSPLMLSHDNTEQRVERVRVCLQGSTWSVPFGLDEVSYVLARERRRCALNRWW